MSWVFSNILSKRGRQKVAEYRAERFSSAVVPYVALKELAHAMVFLSGANANGLFPRCECGKSVDYTDHVIRDVLLNGLSDPDIHKDVLGTKDVLTRPINDVIAFVETKEMARNALPPAPLSSIFTFKQITQAQPTTPSPVPAPSVRDKVSTCPDCKPTFKMFTEGTRGWNTKPHKVCIDCYRARYRRNRRQCRSPQALKANLQAVESDLSDRGLQSRKNPVR